MYATAASISSNIEGAMVCPGEELILTCTGQGPVQRWIITNEDSIDIEVTFSSTSDEQRLISRNFNTMIFEFALISVAFDHFESMVSVVYSYRGDQQQWSGLYWIFINRLSHINDINRLVQVFMI